MAPVRNRSKKSYRQHRLERLMGTVERPPELPPTQLDEEWWEVPGNFGQLQREDPTLQTAFRKEMHIDDIGTEVKLSLSGE